MRTRDIASETVRGPEAPRTAPLHEAVRAFKRELIRRTLLRYGGNRSYAAAALRIERTSLLRLIRELGVDGVPPAQSGRPPSARADRRRLARS